MRILDDDRHQLIWQVEQRWQLVVEQGTVGQLSLVEHHLLKQGLPYSHDGRTLQLLPAQGGVNRSPDVASDCHRQEVNPAGPNVAADALTNGVMTPDHAGGKAYFVSHPDGDQNVLEYFVGEFDLTTLAKGTVLDLYQVQGIPQHMVRWNNSSDGSQGVAFTTKKFNCLYTPCNVADGRLYVIDLPL